MHSINPHFTYLLTTRCSWSARGVYVYWGLRSKRVTFLKRGNF